MSRRNYVFTAELKKTYNFFEKSETNNSEIRCTICNSTINISSDGKTGIIRHIGTMRHKNALKAKATKKNPVTKFFTPQSVDNRIAACEGVWAYHMVKNFRKYMY